MFGRTFFYSYGVHADHHVIADIKSVYLPEEAVAFLETHKRWSVPGVESAHDVAVIELEDHIPLNVAVGTLSSGIVTKGIVFRFGGYGCEQFKRPGELPPELDPRLKYAEGAVGELTPLVAQGPTYDGVVQQSLCQGDSGGPVYVGEAPYTEIIGINNFHKTKESGDEVNSEINFSIITSTSLLGLWVKDVLAGKISPF